MYQLNISGRLSADDVTPKISQRYCVAVCGTYKVAMVF